MRYITRTEISLTLDDWAVLDQLGRSVTTNFATLIGAPAACPLATGLIRKLLQTGAEYGFQQGLKASKAEAIRPECTHHWAGQRVGTVGARGYLYLCTRCQIEVETNSPASSITLNERAKEVIHGSKAVTQ